MYIFFTVLVLGFHLGCVESTLQFTSSLQVVDDNKTEMALACGFNVSGHHNMTHLVSLTISKTGATGSSFTVSVNAFEQRKVMQSPNFEGTAEGVIDVKAQQAYLKVSKVNPALHQNGDFKCEVSGIDSFGQCVEQMEIIKGKSCFSKRHLANLQSKAQHLKEENKRLDKIISDKMVWKTKFVSAFAKEDGSIGGMTSEIFNSSSLYMWTKFSVTYDEAIEVCEKYDAYLAEINTEEEFLFIKTQFKEKATQNYRKKYFSTGAYYKDVTAPFEFLTHPEDPVYTGYWDKKEPHRDSMQYNRLLLKITRNDDVVMVDGMKGSNRIGYLCEVNL